MSSELSLQEPKRQSPVGVAVMFFKNLRAAVNFFLAVIVVQLGSEARMLGLSIWEWAGLLAIFFLIFSILQYRRFSFYVSGDQFIVEKGVINRDKINVPFERIQTVNTTQNVIQRLLSVVGLRIDTAGSAHKEIEIPALERSYAYQLQQYLLARRSEGQESTQEQESEKEDRESEAAAEPLLKLSLVDVLRVGITQNHLRSGFLLFAIINGYIWQYEDYLLQPFEPYLEQTKNTLITSWVLMLPLIILIFLVVAVIYSLVRSVLRYYNLHFYLQKTGIRVYYGLLKRNELRVPRKKVQYLKWSSNPLRQLVGYRTLVIKQAGSQELNDQQSVEIPGIKSPDLLTVLRAFFPRRKAERFQRHSSDYLLFIQYFIWMGLVPLLALAAFFLWLGLSWYFFVPLPFILGLIYRWVYRYYQSVRLRYSPEILEIKKGFIFPSNWSLEPFRIQSLSLRQSVFQKRRGLASLTVHTAAGSQTMPHLAELDARKAYDFLLYQIESRDESWM